MDCGMDILLANEDRVDVVRRLVTRLNSKWGKCLGDTPWPVATSPCCRAMRIMLPLVLGLRHVGGCMVLTALLCHLSGKFPSLILTATNSSVLIMFMRCDIRNRTIRCDSPSSMTV